MKNRILNLTRIMRDALKAFIKNRERLGDGMVAYPIIAVTIISVISLIILEPCVIVWLAVIVGGALLCGVCLKLILKLVLTALDKICG